MYEKNRRIVQIFRQADLDALAKEMRDFATRHVADESPDYPDDTPEGREELKKQAACDEIVKFSRYIIANPLGLLVEDDDEFKHYSFTFTLDDYEDDVKRWHLSICCQKRDTTTMLGIRTIRPSDAMAAFIAEIFLGKGFTEIPCEGKIIKEVRHFIAPM